MQKEKKKSGCFIFIIILIFALFIGAVSIFGDNPRDITSLFFRKDYIAILYIEGVIEAENDTYNQDWLLDTIDDLKYDKRNKGIMLYIDSPGGGVYESDEVYLSLKNYYEYTLNPIYAYQGPLAASGGYYISCAANKIFANRNTLTGSIGVISGQSVDITELLTKIGIKAETITSGKNKNMLNYDSPLTNEQREIMQRVADEAYEQFIDIVSNSRNINIEKVKTLADGRIYTALQAKKENLIDEVCRFDYALDMLEEYLSEYDLYYRTYRYYRNRTFLDLIVKASENIKNSNKAIPQEIRERLMLNISYPAYIYMY